MPAWLQRLLDLFRPRPKGVARLRWAINPQSYFEGATHVRITNEQRVLLTVVALTAAGFPAAIDGDVIFTTSDAAVANIERVNANSAYVNGGNAAGAALITATFDADLGEGVRTITLTGAVEVVQAEAATGVLTFGEPELKPLPPAG